MKKYLISMVVVLLLVVGVYFLVGLFSPNPPSPTVSVDGNKVEVVRGSYCWDGLFNAVCADTISPPELIKSHDIIPIVVPPQAKLRIEFKKEPEKGSVNVSQWTTNDNSENVPISNSEIVLPKEKGIYIYDVSASWKKGSSSYTFVIEVR